MAIKFFSYKDSEETCIMCSPNDKIKVMIGTERDKIIEDLFCPFLQRCQEGLEKSLRGSEFVFDSVDSLYQKLHKISLNRDGSYINSPKSLRNKKATINLKNNDIKCFQYAVTVALNHEQIKSCHERIQNVKPFIDQYDWKEIDFSSDKKNWNDFEKNNKAVSYI